MKRYIFFLAAITVFAVTSPAQTGQNGLFHQEGIASWYGTEFDGKPTASGEVFDSGLFTAAHPTLPFGTIITVTNQQNHRRVTVRINDRGPFVAARIVDLSRAAAEGLDMLATGTAPVLLEEAINTVVGSVDIPIHATAPAALTTEVVSAVSAAEPETPAEIAAIPPPVSETIAAAVTKVTQTFFPAPPAVIKGSIPQAESTKLYRLQVGAYKIPRNAVDAYDKLKSAGLNPAYEQSGEFYRVVLAGLKAADIQSVAQKLGNAGFREALIREETGH